MHIPLMARQHSRLIWHREVDGVNQLHRRLLARVVAALEDGERQQVGIGHPQACDNRLAKGFLGMIQGQTEFSDSQHTAQENRESL
jgi:hypothetical protein